MVTVKLRRLDDAMMIALPQEVLVALRLRENDEVAFEIVDGRVVLTRASSETEEAWEIYRALESRYSDANRRLAE
jgi:antitoxin component of MazEF toxin-antitoxin module